MNLLFIYDSSELREIRKINIHISLADQIHILTIDEHGKKRCLYDIAIDVKIQAPDNKSTILFIDQFLACADESFEWLQRNAGIALIKFLRMMDVRHHIVLITPYTPLRLIQENTTNLIVTSKGISFAKCLYNYSEKRKEELETLGLDRFGEEQDLKTYILAEFRLPEDERHNWANWWGIDRLWNIHKVVEKEKFGLLRRWELNEYPLNLKFRLKELRNREALFLYGHQEEYIVNKLFELNEISDKLVETLQRYVAAKNSFEENKNKIITQLKNDSHQINDLEYDISYITHILPLTNGDSDSYIKRLGDNIKRHVELSKKKTELEQELSLERLRSRQIRNVIDEKAKMLDAIIISIQEEEERYFEEVNFMMEAIEGEIKIIRSKIQSVSIQYLRKKVRELNPKVLFIDDQANEGWSNIFQHIIYNAESQDLFKVIQPVYADQINEQYFIDVVAPIIIEHNPDLILLDLRLKRESGVRVNVDDLSGAILLKEIRKIFPGIPILMTTASNKSWSYEELKHIGCDAFWTKEGIDTGMSEGDSIKNYLRFVELVDILTGKEYNFLKWYCHKFNQIRTAITSWWWETSKYALNEKINRDEIDLILSHTLFLIREVLKNEVINPLKSIPNANWLLPSLIVHNLGKIPELIYNTWSVEYMYDANAKELYKIRNSASHIVQNKTKRTARDFSFEDAKYFSKRVIEYLTLEKTPPIAEIREIPGEDIMVSREELMKRIEEANKRRKQKKN